MAASSHIPADARSQPLLIDYKNDPRKNLFHPGIKDRLTALDANAPAALQLYIHAGVAVSATPLWDSAGEKLIEEINHFLMAEENPNLSFDVNHFAYYALFDTHLKNQTFFIFENPHLPLFHFEIKKIGTPITVKKKLSYKNVIGIGFRFTEDMDLETLKNLSNQTLSLVLHCNKPAFFYHPNLGLKHIPATRLLDMRNGIALSSPVMDFKNKMEQYHITWQSPHMSIYDSFNPESILFSFETIQREDKNHDPVEEDLDGYAENEKISFSFSFPDSKTSSHLPGKTQWVEEIIPVIQLGSKFYLDRNNKIMRLLERRQEFYLKQIFTYHYELLKKTVTQLDFSLVDEFKVRNLRLTPILSNDSYVLKCSFLMIDLNEKILFITCKNDSPLDKEDTYLLVRRLFRYLEIEKEENKLEPALHAPPPRFFSTIFFTFSLYDLGKEDVIKVFDTLKPTGCPFYPLDYPINQAQLNLFLDIYLSRGFDGIYSAGRAQVIVSLIEVFSNKLSSGNIIRCLLWSVANERMDELNQLTLPTLITLRSDLVRIKPISSEVTAALLVLEKITPSPPPPLPKLESKMSLSLPKSPALHVLLPVPKTTEIKSESKSEEKDELKKILWQGKEINQETPLAVVVQYALDQYYLKPYPGQPEKLINRPLHGGTHAIMTVLLVDLFKELFKKYYPNFLVDPITQKSRLSDEEEKLIYLMALYHDSGNTRENQGAETDQTVHANHFYFDAIKMGFSIEASQKCRFLMIHKDNPAQQNIEKVILHDADCLDFLRCVSKENYDLTRLDIYHLIKNNCPSVMPAFQEDMKNIIDYYKSLSTLIYNENVQKKLESKEKNLLEYMYTQMKEEITHYRLMRAIVPEQSIFSFFQIVSAHKKWAINQLYSSLPLVLFYSYKELDNRKIKTIYFNENSETILEKKSEEKEDDGDENPCKTRPFPLYRSYESVKALDSKEKFEGVFFLRALRRKYSEEATIWDRNSAILREEKITNLSELKNRYATDPLKNFRFRPATLILPNVSVKSRWGGCLHILLKPSAVAFWGGFKKNVFSDYFEAKDFAFKDSLPKRTFKTPSSTIISSRVKTMQTLDAMKNKLQEMEEVRRGQKLSHHYRYFGCSALDPNEGFLVNCDSLSASIEALGICCDLTSPTWVVDAISVAQEILTLRPTLPPKIRYFFYLPEKGLTPLSLAEISLIAKGRIQSDLKELGLVEGLNLFNSFLMHSGQHLVRTLTLETTGGFENQKFELEFNTSKGITFATSFMRAGIPCIQVGPDIYFDHTGTFRVLFLNQIKSDLRYVQRLLPYFYWEMLTLHQILDVKMDALPDENKEDKYSIQLSFRFVGSGSYMDKVRALLSWMGYPITHDKLRLLSENPGSPGVKVELTLSYPQTLTYIKQTLTRRKEVYYKHLHIGPYLIPFQVWNQLPDTQKTLLNFCKILKSRYKAPVPPPSKHNECNVISSAINTILPSFKEIPLEFAIGIMELFKEYFHERIDFRRERVELVVQLLLMLHKHCPISMNRVLQLFKTYLPIHILFLAFNVKILVDAKLMEPGRCVYLDRWYNIISSGVHDYSDWMGASIILKHMEYFSLDQLARMLSTLIWQKKKDIKLIIGLEGLLKIEKRFREKKAKSSLSVHVMHSFICGKQKELEEKSHIPSEPGRSSPLFQSRKRKELEQEEENDPKRSRCPADSSAPSPP